MQTERISNIQVAVKERILLIGFLFVTLGFVALSIKTIPVVISESKESYQILTQLLCTRCSSLHHLDNPQYQN